MPALHRVHIHYGGAVQGVGFRPFVLNLARELALTGWVLNSAGGLEIEVEGAGEALRAFQTRLEAEHPPAAVILTRQYAWLAPAGYAAFEIRHSDNSDARTVAVLPDLATCHDCLAEIADPAARRFEYPFTNCTRCGPRYSILTGIPYDRANTTMGGFRLCPACRKEYEEPADRRFHAQPIACPACGPVLSSALKSAARALDQGLIVALKGIGGYQLMVDAQNAAAVARLRQRKHREAKPFAVMMPNLACVRLWARVSPQEEDLLRSHAAPIVLLTPTRKLLDDSSPYLGVMLPYSPLHHLLLEAIPRPLVATSGNSSDEPIAIEEREAAARLGSIADVFVSHNRPIARPCDDSVARISRGRPVLLRRARGYAPMPIRIGRELPRILAVGGHLKSTVALAIGQQVVVSQHIGDLETLETRETFQQTIRDLCRLYDFHPDRIACDLHPGYFSTRWAFAQGVPVVQIQHHEAHVASCAAENEVAGSYLGVAWDGTGFGHDATVWGSEIFLCDGRKRERISHLRPFLLAGGDAAARQCWRCAESLRWELGHAVKLSKVLSGRLNCHLSTSMGRLFDAVASITGICQENRFEGESGLRMEASAAPSTLGSGYPLVLDSGVADWRPLIQAIVADSRPAPVRVSAFFDWLAAWVTAVTLEAGQQNVVLSGGCFQNAVLVERAVGSLERRGIRVFTHQRVPANDGGLCLGQAVIAAGLD